MCPGRAGRLAGRRAADARQRRRRSLVPLRLHGIGRAPRAAIRGPRDGLRGLRRRRRALQSESMFIAHELPCHAGAHEIAICARALDPLLAVRRSPRARWRTKVVSDGNLRWFRTSVAGRAPGFAPGPPVVGPWRSVEIADADEPQAAIRVEVRGREGVVRVQLRRSDGDVEVALAGQTFALPAGGGDGLGSEPGALVAPYARLSASSTHSSCDSCGGTIGDPAAFGSCRTGRRPVGSNCTSTACPCSSAVLCGRRFRGTSDRATLTQLRDCGLNMVRVVGTMIYESSGVPRSLRRARDARLAGPDVREPRLSRSRIRHFVRWSRSRSTSCFASWAAGRALPCCAETARSSSRSRCWASTRRSGEASCSTSSYPLGRLGVARRPVHSVGPCRRRAAVPHEPWRGELLRRRGLSPSPRRRSPSRGPVRIGVSRVRERARGRPRRSERRRHARRRGELGFRRRPRPLSSCACTGSGLEMNGTGSTRASSPARSWRRSSASGADETRREGRDHPLGSRSRARCRLGDSRRRRRVQAHLASPSASVADRSPSG